MVENYLCIRRSNTGPDARGDVGGSCGGFGVRSASALANKSECYAQIRTKQSNALICGQSEAPRYALMICKGDKLAYYEPGNDPHTLKHHDYEATPSHCGFYSPWHRTRAKR